MSPLFVVHRAFRAFKLLEVATVQASQTQGWMPQPVAHCPLSAMSKTTQAQQESEPRLSDQNRNASSLQFPDSQHPTESYGFLQNPTHTWHTWWIRRGHRGIVSLEIPTSSYGQAVTFDGRRGMDGREEMGSADLKEISEITEQQLVITGCCFQWVLALEWCYHIYHSFLGETTIGSTDQYCIMYSVSQPISSRPAWALAKGPTTWKFTESLCRIFRRPFQEVSDEQCLWSCSPQEKGLSWGTGWMFQCQSSCI